MSSLEQQLSRLRMTESSVRNLGVNKTASLVFESSEASCMDWNTIHQMAQQAFNSLSQSLPILVQYQEFLFLSYPKLERSHLTVNESQSISKQLSEILLVLQPYLLQKDCQHIIEYLIRNFEVHGYDGQNLVMSMLPYHNTVLFVKLLQNIQLTNIPSLSFMDNNIKHGLNIPRHMLIKQLTHDPNLLRIMIRQLQQQQEIKGNTSDIVITSKGVRVTALDSLNINFITSLIVDAFGAVSSMGQQLLAVVVEYVAYALGRQQNNMVLSGLMVMNMMVHQNCIMKDSIVKDLALVVMQKVGNGYEKIQKQIVQFYIQLYQNNVITSIDDGHLNMIVSNIEKIIENAESYNLLVFSKKVSVTVIEGQVTDDKIQMLKVLLTEIQLNDHFQKNNTLQSLYFSEIVQNMVDKYQNMSEDKQYQQQLQKIADMIKGIYKDDLLKLVYKISSDSSSQATRDTINTLFLKQKADILYNLTNQLSDKRMQTKRNALQQIEKNSQSKQSPECYYQLLGHFKQEQHVELLNTYINMFKELPVFDVKKLLNNLQKKLEREPNQTVELLNYDNLLQILVNVKPVVEKTKENIVQYYSLVFTLLSLKQATLLEYSHLIINQSATLVIQKQTKTRNQKNQQTRQFQEYFNNEKQMYQMIKDMLLRNQSKNFIRSRQYLLELVEQLNSLEYQIELLLIIQQVNQEDTQNLYNYVFSKIDKIKDYQKVIAFFKRPNQESINAYYNCILIGKPVQQQYNILLDLLFTPNEQQESVQYIALNFLLHLLLNVKQNLLITEQEGIYDIIQQLCIMLPILLCNPETTLRQQIKQIMDIIQSIIIKSKVALKNKHASYKNLKKLVKLINNNFMEIKEYANLKQLFNSNNNSFSVLNIEIYDKIMNKSVNNKIINDYVRFLWLAQLKGIDNTKKTELLQQIKQEKQEQEFVKLYMNIFFCNIDHLYFQQHYKDLVIKQSENQYLIDEMLDQLISKKIVKLNIDVTTELVIELIQLVNSNNYDGLVNSIQMLDFDKEQLIDYLQSQIGVVDQSVINQQLECIWLLLDLNNQSNAKYIKSLLQLLTSLLEQPSITTNNILFSIANYLKHLQSNPNKNIQKGELINITSIYISTVESYWNTLSMQDDEVTLQTIYLYAHCLCMFVSHDQTKIIQYLISKIDCYSVYTSQSHTIKVFLLLLNVSRKIRQYSTCELKKEGELIKRIGRVMVVIMDQKENEKGLIEEYLNSCLNTVGEQVSWLIISLIHEQLESSVQGMKGMIEGLQRFMGNEGLSVQLSMINKLLYICRGMTGQETESDRRVIKKQRAFRQSIGLMNARQMRGIMRYTLVLINRLLAMPVLQDRLEKHLILNEDQLLSLVSQVYLQVINLQAQLHIMVTKSTAGKVRLSNKIKLLSEQVESFVYNILPFQFYAKVVSALQEQLSSYALKQQLYLKMTEKFQAKGNKVKSRSNAVLQTLVQSVVTDLSIHKESSDNHWISYIQSGFVLMALISKQHKQQLTVDVSILMAYLQQERLGIKSSALYALILYLEPVQILGYQKDILETLYVIVMPWLNQIGLSALNKNIHDVQLVTVSAEGDELQLGLKALELLINSQQMLLAPKVNQIVQLLMGIEGPLCESSVSDLLVLMGDCYQWRHVDIKRLTGLTHTSVSLSRLALFVKCIVGQVSEDTFELKHAGIFEALLALVPNLEGFGELSQQIVQVFLQFSLKCNEVQLRKHYSALKTSCDNTGYGRTFFLRVTLCLTNQFQSLFVQFYHFLFQDLLDYLPKSDEQSVLALQCLDSLFRHDKDEFIDSSKFDCLSRVLPELLQNSYNNQEMNSHVTQTILSLFNLVTDDYKRKGLHQQIIMLLNEEDVQLVKSVIAFIQTLLESVKDQYIPLINDLLPYLHNLLDHQSLEIESSSKSLLIRLEQISGENIRDYLRNE